MTAAVVHGGLDPSSDYMDDFPSLCEARQVSLSMPHEPQAISSGSEYDWLSNFGSNSSERNNASPSY